MKDSLSVSQESACNAGDLSSIPGSRRSQIINLFVYKVNTLNVIVEIFFLLQSHEDISHYGYESAWQYSVKNLYFFYCSVIPPDHTVSLHVLVGFWTLFYSRD